MLPLPGKFQVVSRITWWNCAVIILRSGLQIWSTHSLSGSSSLNSLRACSLYLIISHYISFVSIAHYIDSAKSRCQSVSPGSMFRCAIQCSTWSPHILRPRKKAWPTASPKRLSNSSRRRVDSAKGSPPGRQAPAVPTRRERMGVQKWSTCNDYHLINDE